MGWSESESETSAWCATIRAMAQSVELPSASADMEVPPVPPSLEDQCFLLVICRLEEYPIEWLSLLPGRLREKLLINLPAVDVCQLEQHASFAEGIDFGAVWSTMFTKRQLKTVDMGDDPDSNTPWKEQYFRSISDLVLNSINEKSAQTQPDRLRSLLKLLLFVENCLDMPNCLDFAMPYLRGNCMEVSEEGRIHQGMVAASRYASYMQDGPTTLTLVRLMMEKCNYYPKALLIVCNNFARSDLWQSRKQHAGLISDFLCQVQTLIFVFEDLLGLNDSNLVPSEFIKAACTRKSRALTTLVINDCSLRTMGEIIISIAPLFANIEGTSETNSSVVPYRGLREIMLTSRPRFTERWISNGAAEKLAQIIDNQTSITSVNLVSWNPYHRHKKPPSEFYHLHSSLTNLLGQPYLDTLALGGFFMPLSSIQEMLFRFFMSSYSQIQGLMLGGLELSTEEESPSCAPMLLEMSDDCIHHKRFSLVEMDAPEPVISWLFSCKKLRFRVFELNTVKCRKKDLFHLVASHPNFEVDQLRFIHMPITNQSTQKDYDAILQKTDLKHLTLKDVELGLRSLLPQLTHALLKQAKVGTLKTLDITGNDIGDCSQSHLELFFNAVFSLPQIEEFKLVLASNDLRTENYTLLHQVGTQKLKKLSVLDCSGTNGTLPDSFIPDMIAFHFVPPQIKESYV